MRRRFHSLPHTSLVFVAIACSNGNPPPGAGNVSSVVEWPLEVHLKAVVVSHGITYVAGQYSSPTAVELPGGLSLPPSTDSDGFVARMNGPSVAAVGLMSGTGRESVDDLAADPIAGVIVAATSTDSGAVKAFGQTVTGPGGKLIVAHLDPELVPSSTSSTSSSDARVSDARVASTTAGDLIVGCTVIGGPGATSFAGIPVASRVIVPFLRFWPEGSLRWAKALGGYDASVAIAEDGTVTVSVWTAGAIGTNDFGIVDAAKPDVPRLVIVHADPNGATAWSQVWLSRLTNGTRGSVAASRDGTQVAVVGAVGSELATGFANWTIGTGFVAVLDARTGVPKWYHTDPSTGYDAPHFDDEDRLWSTLVVDNLATSVWAVAVDPKRSDAALVRISADGTRLEVLSLVYAPSVGHYTAVAVEPHKVVAVGYWYGAADGGDGVERIGGVTTARSISLEWRSGP